MNEKAQQTEDEHDKRKAIHLTYHLDGGCDDLHLAERQFNEDVWDHNVMNEQKILQVYFKDFEAKTWREIFINKILSDD